MSDLLSIRSAAWESLALPGTLVVLDFDGTLARIVPDRNSAGLSGTTRAALEQVAASYPVAILSGRSVRDVSARLDGVGVRWLVGSHGAEWPGDGQRHVVWRSRVTAWLRVLRPRLRGASGVEIENKRLSLAVHYRRTVRPARARALVHGAAADLPGVVLLPGKRVLNLVPAGAGDKGTALRRLVDVARASRVLFMGDDVTDEAAFAVRLSVPSVRVRVGYDPVSRAAFHVRHRAEVDRCLVDLATRRTASPGQRRKNG